MQKKTHDYDNVFKTMKSKHKRLFIPVINDIFIETGQEDGLDDTVILKRIQAKIGLSLEETLECMNMYGKQTL